MIVRDLPRVIEHLDGDQVGLLCDTVLCACGGATVEVGDEALSGSRDVFVYESTHAQWVP